MHGNTGPCRICATANREGWWSGTIPSGFTHCDDCHQTWPGSRKWGECSRCHAIFAGTRAFDTHQRTNKDGEITDAYLCSVLTTPPGSPKDANLARYVVSPSQTPVRTAADWGMCWGIEADQLDPTIFTKAMRSTPVERADR